MQPHPPLCEAQLGAASAHAQCAPRPACTVTTALCSRSQDLVAKLTYRLLNWGVSGHFPQAFAVGGCIPRSRTCSVMHTAAVRTGRYFDLQRPGSALMAFLARLARRCTECTERNEPLLVLKRPQLLHSAEELTTFLSQLSSKTPVDGK